MTSNTPPNPKKIPFELEAHGDIRIDNYYWMRDDSRSDQELISYLESENEYFKKWIKGNSGYYKSVFIVLFTILFVGNFPSLSPGPNWDSMIHVKSILHWFQLAFISGTYPILPWIAFYFIGSNLDGNKINEKWSPHLLRSGSLAFSTLLATLAISITEEMNWAETMGRRSSDILPCKSLVRDCFSILDNFSMGYLQIGRKMVDEI